MIKQQISNPEVLNEAYCYDKPSGFSRGIKLKISGSVFLFISGTASIDENGNTIHIGDFRQQTERTYHNIKKLLEVEGATWADVVKTTVYIKDINKHYDEFNFIRMQFFKQECIDPFPASVGVEAKLCREDLLIEMDAIAVIDSNKK